MRSWLAFGLIGIVFPFALAEGLARLFMEEVPSRSLYRLHPIYGWALRPNSLERFDEEGQSIVMTNARGFRDIAHSVEREADVFRIAILGDSFLEAKQVAFEQSFPAVLRGLLQDCLNRPVEVLNFSVQGYGTVQQYLLYKHEARQYAPDLVLLGFYEGNDVYDNHPQLNPNNPELAPYLDLEAAEFRIGIPRRGLVFHIRSFLVEASRHSVVLRMVLRWLAPVWQQGRGLTEAEYEWVALRAPVRDEVREAWDATERTIRQLKALVQADGARLLVLSIPTAVSLHPEAGARERFRKRWKIADFSYPVRRLQELLPGKDEFLALGPKLEPAAQQEYLYGFENHRMGYGHWNERGHRAAAAATAAHLCLSNRAGYHSADGEGAREP